MKIAIIGGGVGGLTAGYLLHKKHDVVLFEKSARLGGNAYTHVTPDGETPDIAVAAFGKAGYKNLYKLFAQLNIETVPCYASYMSFHDLDSRDGVYLTPSIGASLTQRFQLFKPDNIASLLQLLLGLQVAQRRLELGLSENVTVDQSLRSLPGMSGNSRLFFLCALSLLSSMSVEEVLGAPAAFFFNKLKVHHDVISPKAAYSVGCAKHGTRSYINALAAGFRKKIVFNAEISAILRDEHKVTIALSGGRKEVFDKVIIACGADEALNLLEKPTKKENELLGAWKYKEGDVVVHRDYSAFPPRDLIESYTFLYSKKNEKLQVSINGALWHLPHVSRECEYMSSQHPNFPIRPELIELKTKLRTPIFDFSACASQKELPSLNNVLNTFYCGSYFGYGLHEDAVSSAMAAANYL